MHSSQTKYKVNDLRIKSPNKVNTDHLKIMVFSFSGSACPIMLNYHSIIHLIISLTLTLLQCSFMTLLRAYITIGDENPSG